jgi:hypothetical protein
MRKVRTITAAAVMTMAIPLLAVPAASASPAVHESAGSRAAPVGPKPVVRVHGMHLVHVVLPSTHLPHLVPHRVVKSGNWSGHAAVARPGRQLRFVSASFTIPSVNCAMSPLGSSGFAFASNWVGLDGFKSRTVEQTGVDSFCDSSGTPQYDAWYEMYPLPPVAFAGVNAGDAMSASVFFSGGKYSITLTDVTTAAKMQVTQRCPRGSTCRNSSAEVITEDPGQSAPVVNLADYGMVNFTGAAVTSVNGTKGSLSANSLWTSSEIVMQNDSKKVMSQPSGLFGGKAFNVTWKAAR